MAIYVIESYMEVEGGAKDWSLSQVLLERAVRQTTRIIICREVQNTIADSIHQLLSDQIVRLGLSSFFTVTAREIMCTNGSSFSFKGLRDMDPEKIKSFEGADIAVIIEAQSLSKKSFDILDPTIRKAGSEIWIDFNTQYEDDFVYQRFVINPPPNCIIEKVGLMDNPWRSKELVDMYERAKAECDPDFANIWEGEPLKLGGRIYSMFEHKNDPLGHVRVFTWENIRNNGNCVMALDPHSHYYPAAVWVAILPKNKRGHWPEDFYKYIYNEYPTQEMLGGAYHDFRKTKKYNGTLADMSKEIYGLDGTSEHGIKIMKRSMDPRFATGSGSWDYSSSTEGIVSVWRKPENGGLEFTLPNVKVLDSQRENIKTDLSWNKLSDRSVYNEPTLYVAPWCYNVIATLNNHRLQDQTEKEDERYKDFSDAVRIAYASMNNWNYVNPLTMDAPARELPGRTTYNMVAGVRVSEGWMS